MQQVVYSEYTFSIFDSRNYTFYTKELFPVVREFSWTFCDSIDTSTSGLDVIFENYYSLGVHPMNYDELLDLKNKNSNNFVFLCIVDFVNTYFMQWYNYLLINDQQVQLFVIDLIIQQLYNQYINYYFIFLLTLLSIIKWHYDHSMVGYTTRTNFTLFYQFITYDFLTLVLNKYESSEEAICSIVLWPWCFLLVFTHVFLIDNNEIIFIFVEWGLPVIYGFFLLIEHIWNFGSHFLVYLNGGRGRRSITIVIVEDILTFFIVIIRVSLQVVRGLLCGFFHNLFRDIADKVANIYHTYCFYTNWNIPFVRTSTVFVDVMSMFAKWYFLGWALLFIYAILFLQALFLVIAVWLFCRCWFISSHNTPDNIFVDDYFKNKVWSPYDHRRDIYLRKVIIDEQEEFDARYTELMNPIYV